MQDLYVFRAAVESKDTEVSPWSRGLDILSSWATRTMSGMTIASEDLLTSDNMGRVPSRHGGEKSASWKYAEYSEGKMVRIDVWDYPKDGDQSLLTRVTFGTSDGTTYSLRVVVSRESVNQTLSPLRKADVYQPGFVRTFAESKYLRCIIGLEILTSRYKNVRQHRDVDDLINYIQTPQRLPIVIIHSNTLEAIASARSAATRLIGLTRVFTVDYRSKTEIERRLPNMSPRRSSAILIWPDITLPPELFNHDTVNSENSDSLRSRLMERLSLVSVMRRGYDEVFSSVQSGARKERELREEEERSALRKSSNNEDIIKSLEKSLATSRENEMTWQEMAESLQADLEGMQGAQTELTSLQREVESLQEQIEYFQDFHGFSHSQISEEVRSTNADHEDQWMDVPRLRSGDQKSMESLIRDLEDRSMGRLVFSKRVPKEWRKARYPYPEDMDKALLSMAKLAVDYWENNVYLQGNWKQAFMDRCGINFAQFDKAISSDPELRDFNYDGRKYDRTPHLKLRDNTSHDKCGRIYFAIDNESGRFIVDHAGQKIHNVGIRS